eukprot:ANDGO_06876.mRNA.1 Cyanobacterial phytochrome B
MQKLFIASCEKEPLPFSGNVLNYGVLLGISLIVNESGAQSSVIVNVSDNVRDHFRFSVEQLLYQSLSVLVDSVEIFEEGPTKDLSLLHSKTLAYAGETSRFGPISVFINEPSVSVENMTKRQGDSSDEHCSGGPLRHFPGFAFMTKGILVLELDCAEATRSPQRAPSPWPSNSLQYVEMYRRGITTMNERMSSCKTLHDVCTVLGTQVFEFLGCDRCMVYEFDVSDESGDVICEWKRDGVTTSYDGLHFPASDIPLIARSLYVRNPIRCIPDVDIGNSRILPTSSAIDLSNSFLRSVSPVHVQYLKNMKVCASLSLSIVVEGRLWGLVSCHHYSPFFPPLHVRSMCECLSKLASTTISEKIRQTKAATWNADLQLVQAVVSKLIFDIHDENLNPTHVGLSRWLQCASPTLMTRLRSSLMILKVAGTAFVSDQCPSVDPFLELCSWLRSRSAPQRQTLSSYLSPVTDIILPSVQVIDCLKEEFPSQLPYDLLCKIDGGDDANVAGVVFVPLSPNCADFLAFFRPEKIRTIKWLGNPAQKEANESGLLSPKLSFDSYLQTIVGRSERWNSSDVDVCRMVQEGLFSRMQNISVQLEERRAVKSEYQKLAALESDKLRRGFLSHLSHQMRTPFNNVLDTLNDLARKEDVSQESIHLACSSATSALMLIDNLLELLQLETSAMDLVEREASLPEQFEKAAKILQVAADRRGVRLFLSIHPDIPSAAIFDVERLNQVLINILGNAVKYTEPRGSVFMNVVLLRQIDPSLVEKDNEATIVVSVRDEGIGMGQDVLDNLFNPLFPKEAAVSKRKYGGSCLGLTLCKQIVDRMRGRIDVDSSVGSGSEFIIRLPLRLPMNRPMRLLRDDYLVVSSKIGWLRDNYPTVLVLAGAFFDTIAWLLRFFGFDVIQCTGLASLKHRLQFERKYVIFIEDESLYFDLPSTSEATECLLLVKEAALRNSHIIRIRSEHMSKIVDPQFSGASSSSSSSGFSDTVTLPPNTPQLSPYLRERKTDRYTSHDGISYSEDLLPLVQARFDESILRIDLVAAEIFEKIGEFSDVLKLCKTYTIFKPLTLLSIEETLVAVQKEGIHNLTFSVKIGSANGWHDEPRSDPSTVSDAKKCALVAEDNPLNARVLAKHLSRLEWDYDIACHGVQAVEHFQANPQKYSVVLMDCFMPIWTASKQPRRSGWKRS